MNRRIMIIMNPKAGRGTAKTALFTLCDGFTAMQDSVNVFVTQYDNHAKELCIEHASKFDILVCLGGDGTWNEVVNGMMFLHQKPHLAYLPSGTINDFASTLKLPKSASRLIEKIETAVPFCCDIGKFNKRYFTYVAAFGIFTEISYSTPQNAKHSFGKAAYIMEGMKQLTKIPTYHIKAIIEEEVIEDDCIFGCISNSKYVAGFTSVNAQYAELDDGLFEILLIRRPNNPLDVQTILSALLKREVNEHWMYFRKSSSIHIESATAIPWTLDGEDGGKTKNAMIQNKNKAITILV